MPVFSLKPRAPSGPRRPSRLVAGGVLALVLPACTSYSGVAVKEDEVYLTGQTTFLFFSKSWVRRCIGREVRLRCADVDVSMGLVLAGDAPPTGQVEEAKPKEVAAAASQVPAGVAVPARNSPPSRRADEDNPTEVNDPAELRVGDRVSVTLRNGTTHSGIFTGQSATMMSLNCNGSPVAVYLSEVVHVTRGAH